MMNVSLKLKTVLAVSMILSACSTAGEQVQQQHQFADTRYQEVPVPDSFISDEYPRPDMWAQYPGGQDILQRFIAINTRIPEKARREGFTGRLIITYVVDAEGKAGNVNAVMSPSESITEMYKNIINNMPQWKPALLNGIPVEQQYVIVTRFSDTLPEID